MARCGWGERGPPSQALTLPPLGVPAGFLKEGCELINEALNLFNNVYGAMHVEICACLRLLARLHYIMGDYAEVGLVHPLGYVSRGLRGWQVRELGLCSHPYSSDRPATGLRSWSPV